MAMHESSYIRSTPFYIKQDTNRKIPLFTVNGQCVCHLAPEITCVGGARAGIKHAARPLIRHPQRHPHGLDTWVRAMSLRPKVVVCLGPVAERIWNLDRCTQTNFDQIGKNQPQIHSLVRSS